ncbi:MAG TPA: NAD(P)/FAD-dependent oxidoreductase [Terriglobales bacterium]
MPVLSTIAVIGGGPAGSTAAACLAQAGRKTIVFDEKLAWEKPCGGGITHKALEAWPFLGEAEVERNWILACELTAPSGRQACFHLDQPVAIFSRIVLNALLLERAGAAGAEIVQDRVVELARNGEGWRIKTRRGVYGAGDIIIAAGARNPFRRMLGKPFAPEDLMATAGYYIPGNRARMQIAFLPGLYGYVWIFPRAGHVSAGICGKLAFQSTAELRKRFESELARMGLDFTGAQFYSHVLPALRPSTLREPVCGEGWIMAGDAAGFVDPITGEGLYYALRSGELAAQAVLSHRPASYAELVRRDFLPELEAAAGIAGRFYSGHWMGKPVVERMVQFTLHSPSFRDLMRDMFAGAQGYLDLRQRLYRGLPRMLTEALAGILRLRGHREQEVDAA